jgi:copper chaperone
MERVILGVEGMACEHCVRAVKAAVGALPGVGSVQVDLAAKTATVEYAPSQCSLEKIREEIEGQGYDLRD